MDTTPSPDLYRLMFDAVPLEQIERSRDLTAGVLDDIARQVAAETEAEAARINAEIERLLVNGGDPVVVTRPGWLTGPAPSGSTVVTWSDLREFLSSP